MTGIEFFYGREFDVLLPADCRGCSSVNAELNACARFASVGVRDAKAYRAAAKSIIDFVELNCTGLQDPNDPNSCPIPVSQIVFTAHLTLPIGPVDIVDR
jgi:hypothetical protein